MFLLPIEKDVESADEFEIDTLPTFKFIYKNKKISDTVRGYVYDELSDKAEQYYEEVAKKPNEKPKKAKDKDWKCNWWILSFWCPVEKIEVCLKENTKRRAQNKTEIPIHIKSTPQKRSPVSLRKRLNNSEPKCPWKLEKIKVEKPEPKQLLETLLPKSIV